MSASAHIRFVLVGTQHPGNIGAAARAMKTMGLARLVLVAPEKGGDEEALRRAAGAEGDGAETIIRKALQSALR